MGMRIANNIAAMTTHRFLGVADSGLNKSLERLSSGYRINRAADDAAGLAISQGFRADIASFRVASRNTSEASALLQVAEGGMDQVGNILTRLKELATQAASANVDSTDRVKINAEASALITEIDRISDATKYGNTTLLDGTFGGTATTTTHTGGLKIGSGAVAGGGTGTVSLYTASTGQIAYDAFSGGANIATINYIGNDVIEGTNYRMVVISNATFDKLAIFDAAAHSASGFAELGSVVTDAGATIDMIKFANLGLTITLDTLVSAAAFFHTTDAGATLASYTGGGGASFTIDRVGLTSIAATTAATVGTYTISDSGGVIRLMNPSSEYQAMSASASNTFNFDALGITLTLGSDYASDELNGMTISVAESSSSSGGTKTFLIGNENNADNKIDITVNDVGMTALAISGVSLTTATLAQTAMASIDSAIGTLATSRGNIGAYMNRLSYAAANLASTIENIQSAESVIRDVDMASEMTQFTKNQILLQAGTAMLAQANMAPQQVLALFG